MQNVSRGFVLVHVLVTCWSQCIANSTCSRVVFSSNHESSIPRIGSVTHLPHTYLFFTLQWRMDVERDEEAEPQGGWEWVKTQEEKMKKEREEVCTCTPDC